MSQFSFPILENDELLSCLEEMELSMDANQLAKPVYETVKPAFEHLVIMLTGVTREELTQPVFTAMDAFEYPELHDESIPMTNFFRQLNELMMACGVKDFSWRQDVFKPEPPRLKRHLSAIVNFAKFREEKALAFQELQAQLDAMTEEAGAAEEELGRNMAELQRAQASRSAQQAEVSGLEAEDAAVVAHNSGLNKAQAALQNEVRQLKAQGNSLADAASQAKLDLSALKQEAEALADQVVQSPDKHRQAIAELVSAAEARRTYGAQLTSASIDNDRKLEMVAKFEKEVGRCLKAMEELDSAIVRKKDVSQQVKDVRDAVSSNERVLGELTNTNATMKRQQAAVVEKLQRQEAQASLRMEAAVSCVEEQLKGKEAVEAEHAAAAAKAAEDEAQIRSIRERGQETQALHEAQVRGVLEKYNALRRTVAEYNRRLEAAVDQAQPLYTPMVS